jgi:hypothetical protein
MAPEGAPYKKRLCWRGPAAIYWAGLYWINFVIILYPFAVSAVVNREQRSMTYYNFIRMYITYSASSTQLFCVDDDTCIVLFCANNRHLSAALEPLKIIVIGTDVQ